MNNQLRFLIQIKICERIVVGVKLKNGINHIPKPN